MKRALALGIVVVGLAALFVRLGVWQLHRLAERRAANAEVRWTLEQPPVELRGAQLAQPAAARLAYRRAEASGSYDPAEEIVVRGRTWKGSPGVELVTPLILEGGGEVSVNRGWLPSPDAATVDAAAYREPGHVRVRGFLRPASAGELPLSVGSGLVLQQSPDPSLPRYPIRRGDPELDDGPHLSYAIQWFAFAAIALVGCATYFWKRRGPLEGQRPADPQPSSARHGPMNRHGSTDRHCAENPEGLSIGRDHMRSVRIAAASGAELASGVEPEEVFQLEGNWYFDPACVNTAVLEVTERTYTCPYKGTCNWVDCVGEGLRVREIAWVYGDPKSGYERIKGRYAFYPTGRAGATVSLGQV